MSDLAPAAEAAPADGAPVDRPAAIRVEGLEKTFRIPTHQVQTLKERALHPFRRNEYHELNVLRGISFEIDDGEFFGIVGRNGSGKSTLLKCLAGIYRADAGRISVAGRLSPFIELGVGFNPDLTARDNVVLNAVMMGLTASEARARFDDVIRFAELEDFVELKLKNYSSGMQVRLAFSVMVQSRPDVLLIDEVLAVGDAAFQQRCLDEFARLKRNGRTIVLVTHDMKMVERFCDRALLLTDGEIEVIGNPHEVGQRYLERNFETFHMSVDERSEEKPAERARITDVWLEDDSGERIESVAHGTPLHLRATIEVEDTVEEPIVEFWVDHEEGARILGASTRPWSDSPPLRPGDRLQVRVDADNRLASGRYHIGCSLLSGSAALQVVTLVNRHTPFLVFGSEGLVWGIVRFDHELSVEREPR